LKTGAWEQGLEDRGLRTGAKKGVVGGRGQAVTKEGAQGSPGDVRAAGGSCGGLPQGGTAGAVHRHGSSAGSAGFPYDLNPYSCNVG
jgi:hypothetical protein